VERAFRRRRGTLTPDCIDDLTSRDRTPKAREQIGENGSLLGTRKVERTFGPYDLERAEDAELHR